MIEIIKENLLNSKEKYIAHQCNCITKSAAGIALDIFKTFPYANTYTSRQNPDIPGQIQILGDGVNNRFIINMYAQYYPGKIKFPDSNVDGIKAREKNFYNCLSQISKIKDLTSIAFPFGIGCGFAGGNWDNYFIMLNNFATYIKDTQNAKVILYKKD